MIKDSNGVPLPAADSNGVLGFYGRLSPSGVLVYINEGTIYNSYGATVGATESSNTQLHESLVGEAISLNGRKNRIGPIRAKRTKAEEMWHRAASGVDRKEYVASRQVMRAPRAIIHASPSGARAVVSIESIYRPSTDETITFTSVGIVVTKGKHG